MTGSDSPWVRAWNPRPEAKVRLVCFPWAGGSALAFRPWAMSFPPEVEVCAIEYPGRSTRDHEPPLHDVGQLVAGVASANPLLLGTPLVVVGYSLGALVAYEWLLQLARQGLAPSVHLLPCARRAPHLPGRHAPVHALPQAELITVLRERFDAIPDVLLGEPELLERFMIPLRADLTAVENYRYVKRRPLDCPITALGGRRDPDVSREELSAWAAHTTAGFTLEQLDAGHFFVGDPRLREVLMRLCTTTPLA
jgi:medium-chain acyl-[acyl-carrier-protein] hydrolase